MTDIFDAERARRLTLLRQSSVSNRIRLNPDTASFLRRYEDADVSRLNLLEAQRLRNESEAQTKLIKSQQKRLKKRFRTGKGLPKGRGRQPRQPRAPAAPEKSALEVEIQRAKELAAIAAQKKKEEVEEERFRVERLDARLERRRIERSTREQSRQEAARLQQRGFIEQAKLQQIGFDNQAARQTQLAIADRSERRLIADAGDLRRLNADRLRIQQLQIDNNFQDNQQERALRDRQLAGERERYNVDLARVQADREREVGRVNAELEGVRERVAREDAFRHRQLDEQQRLALEQLAQQRRDNSQQSELERNRIDNQRAVDAERAITDRELIQGFTAAVGALNTQRDQEPAALAPSAEEIADRVRQDLAEGLRAGARAASPLPRSRSGSSSPGPEISELRTRQPPERLGEFATDQEAARILGGQRRQPPGAAATIAALGQSLEEVDESGSLTDRPTVRIGGPAAAPLNLSPRSRSSTSSSSSDEQRLPADSQRTLSIMRSGSRSTTPPRPLQRGFGPESAAFGEGQEAQITGALRRDRLPDAPSPDPIAGSAEREASQAGLRSSTPPPRSRSPRARGQVDTIAEETTLQQVGGAVGGVVSGAARLAGGAIGGVGQGIYEQLPSAGDVGAAVGRGGVRAVSGVAGAVYEGLVGGEEEEEPIDRSGGD